MVDICHIIPIHCHNNSQCAVTITSNTTYCKCDPCYEGFYCETIIKKQTQFDTPYIYLIIIIIGLILSLWNNILALEVFAGFSRIRRTNCGIYLIVYSIVSIISSIVLVGDQTLKYYLTRPNSDDRDQYVVYSCYLSDVGSNTLIYNCTWLSACVAFERGLIIYFNSKPNAARCRSFVVIAILCVVAVGFTTPMIVYKCNWNDVPNLRTLREFSILYHSTAGIIVYILATLLVLISFARRIHQYGTESSSCIKTFMKLFYRHLFVFIPPIAFGCSYIPYRIAKSTISPTRPFYFQCGISTAEFIIKILAEILQGIPVILTWLLFVYPSRVYMAQFYRNTWSGKWLFKILKYYQRIHGRKKTPPPPTTDSIDRNAPISITGP